MKTLLHGPTIHQKLLQRAFKVCLIHDSSNCLWPFYFFLEQRPEEQSDSSGGITEDQPGFNRLQT